MEHIDELCTGIMFFGVVSFCKSESRATENHMISIPLHRIEDSEEDLHKRLP